jgi:hypothetical protein
MRPDPDRARDSNRRRGTDEHQGAQSVSLYTVVSRGVSGRFGQRPNDPGANVDQVGTRNQSVRLPGASMRVLEAGLALTAIVTAILIGVGR